MKTNIKVINTYINLPKYLYSEITPYQNRTKKMEVYNDLLAEQIGLEDSFKIDGLDVLVGNDTVNDVPFISQGYAGHQFGHFTMLGDGRAVLLGEFGSDGLDIQLKGSGKTPYSRRGDGLATLYSMLREYLISEAMYGLNIPTTRSLSVISTKDNVQREELVQGAVMARVAKSHIRVGTFEFAVRNGSKEEFKQFVDYTIQRHFKWLPEKDRYLHFLREVVRRQAKLIAKWMSVGFIHGVMNTDNMLISGESIDYGPCAFMDNYDLATVFSSIDKHGRYAYGNQPQIAAWDLSRFAETLLDLIDVEPELAIKKANMEIDLFQKVYMDEFNSLMSNKIGLNMNQELVDKLLVLMKDNNLDYTNTFIRLTLKEKIVELGEWTIEWKKQEIDYELMKINNPVVIPRNYYVEEVLELAVNGNYEEFYQFLELLKTPFEHSIKHLDFFKRDIPTRSQYKTFCGT